MILELGRPSAPDGEFSEPLGLKKRQRKLILSAFGRFNDSILFRAPLDAELRRIQTCSLAMRAEGYDAELYGCYSIICPFCSERRAIQRVQRYKPLFDRYDRSEIGMFTLNGGHFPPHLLFNAQHGLGLGLERTMDAFTKWWECASTGTTGPVFRGGIVAYHTYWDFDASPASWNVHAHALLVGSPDADQQRHLKRLWAEISGNHAQRAAHWLSLETSVGTTLRYMNPSMISTFVNEESRNWDLSRTRTAYRLSAQHPEALTEWIATVRPMGIRGRRTRRMMASLGSLRTPANSI